MNNFGRATTLVVLVFCLRECGNFDVSFYAILPHFSGVLYKVPLVFTYYPFTYRLLHHLYLHSHTLSAKFDAMSPVLSLHHELHYPIHMLTAITLSLDIGQLHFIH